MTHHKTPSDIPISTSPSPSPSPSSATTFSRNLDHISSSKRTLYTVLGTRRPWRQLFNRHALVCPPSLLRLTTNLSYFRVNFAIFILILLFLSLIYHPVSLVVFLVMLLAWLFLFFLREQPMIIAGRAIDDRYVLGALTFFTVGFLLFTGVTWNVVVSLSIGFSMVIIYSMFRVTDDLYADEEAAQDAGIMASPAETRPGHYHHISPSNP